MLLQNDGSGNGCGKIEMGLMIPVAVDAFVCSSKMRNTGRSYWYGQLSVFVCVFQSEVMTPFFGATSSNVELRNPLGWGVSICLGESQSRIYSHMRAKFGRGPTVVSKKGGYDYETFTSMSSTILPTMCQLLVCRVQYCQQCVNFWW